MEERTYNKEERFDARTIEALKLHYTEILRLLGEDPTREGLLKTPERVAKAMSFLTKGYEENPLEIIRSATFREEYKQMVLVKDIELLKYEVKNQEKTNESMNMQVSELTSFDKIKEVIQEMGLAYNNENIVTVEE